MPRRAGSGRSRCAGSRAIGATVIATVGSADKVALAIEAGADHVLVSRGEGIADFVRGVTGGAGVEVVFDGVGKATWEASLASVRRRGLVVSFGNASGPVEGVALGALARAGSVYVTRPTMFDYYVTPEERAAGSARLFQMLRSGAVSVNVGQRFALEDAADAHRALEAGKTTGSTILIP
jgi:NADPH2:quinone reductase